MSELRQMNSRREESRQYVADDEADGDAPGRRYARRRGRHQGVRRRTDIEKAVSVGLVLPRFNPCLRSFQRQVRGHMETLIPRDRWLQDLIHPEELAAWNPDTGPCCTPTMFKLNLGGTPRDDWNTSASRVFTDDFMATHRSLYEDNWDNRNLVLNKTQAYIKTLIQYYRRKNNSDDVTNQTKVAHRRRERKTAVKSLPTAADQF